MSVERGTVAALKPSPDDDGDTLPKNERFDLLRNRRRRDVLRYLIAADRTVTLPELAEHIAALENDVAIEELDYSQRKRVYVALYQTHLPKLDRANVLDYESGRGNITVAERISELEPYLDDGPSSATDAFGRTGRFYLQLGATGGGAVLIAHAAVLQSPSLPLSLLSSLLIVFLLVSFIHTFSEREP